MNEMRIGYRAPWDWSALRAFLARRAAPGTCAIEGESWAQSLRLGDHIGWLVVAHDVPNDEVRVRISDSLEPCSAAVRARVREALDLDCDSARIERHLAADPLLAPSIVAHPGLRVPGAMDGFEVALRAILGQQVSVAGATTLFGRLVMRFGEPLAETRPGIERAVPSAQQLAQVPASALATIGLPRARAETLHGLAQAVASGQLRLEAGDAQAADGLDALRGIGPWTRDYIAMRVLRNADAFPAADIGIRRALGALPLPAMLERAQRWRPWRSYAAMHLWQLAAQGG